MELVITQLIVTMLFSLSIYLGFTIYLKILTISKLNISVDLTKIIILTSLIWGATFTLLYLRQ